MENNKEAFNFTYSAEQQSEIKAIREKYMPKEESKLARLRTLDAAVTRKATVLSITVGVLGTLIMGLGMSFTMSSLGSILGSKSSAVGIITGCIGIAILALAYPLYSYTLKKERKKAAPEIIRLTDELIK